MACIAFIASLLITGIIGSLVEVDTNSTRSDQDYHLVPFAGDVWGA